MTTGIKVVVADTSCDGTETEHPFGRRLGEEDVTQHPEYLDAQFAEASKLKKAIKANLKGLGFDL